MTQNNRLEYLPLTDSGWMPSRLQFEPAPARVEWWHTGFRRLTDPFMTESLNRWSVSSPFPLRLRIITSFDAVRQWAEAAPSLAPTGFIVHLSRCGSTVVSRALMSDPRNRVLSEPYLIGNVLAAGHYIPQLGQDGHENWLRWTIAAISRPLPGETRMFLKFNSWALSLMPMIRKLYPDVPWLLIFRQPVEIMASQMKDPAIFMTRQFPPELLGMEKYPEPVPVEEHMARVIATFGRQALDIMKTNGGRVMMMDYRELPGSLKKVYDFFGIPFTAMDQHRLQPVLSVHAKNPGKRFVADTEQKQRQVSPALRAAAEKFADPVYHQLIEARDAQNAAITPPVPDLTHPQPPPAGRGLPEDAVR